MEIESPEHAGQTAVLLASVNPHEVEELSAIVMPAPNSPGLTGNICLPVADELHCSNWNYRTYFIGQQSLYGWTNFWLVRYYLLIPALIGLVVLLLAGWLNGWLQRRADWRLEERST
jgi:hypothetical protein